MSKAKIIAISAICSAVVFGCAMLATLPFVRYISLLLGVVASVAAVIPIMLDFKNIVYTLLIYFIGSVLAVFFGLANIVFVAPIVTFCIPFTIVKVSGETLTVSASVEKETLLDDPFDDSKQKMVEVSIQGKPRIPTLIRWILYYVILESALGLTVLATWLFTRPTFQLLVKTNVLWIVLGVVQLVVYPYNMLMHGMLVATQKVIRRAVKP